MSASGSKKVIYAALVGNSLIAITKFGAGAFTGSAAMISEAIHSLVDTGNQGLLLYGLHRAKKPADAQFPFGHGKEVYFWSFVVAILIFAVGSSVAIYEGIHHIRHPTPSSNLGIAYAVLGAAMIFEGFAWYFAFREFTRVKGRTSYLRAIQEGKDPTLFVVLFEDSAAMLGLIVAMVGIALGQWTGNPMWDGVASVMIGMILGGTAIWLAYETKSLLIGEAAEPRVVAGIREIAHTHPEVERINECLTLHMGPEFILLNLSVKFREGLSTGAVERTIATLTRTIKAEFPRVKRVFIEAEAAPALCP